MEEHSQNLQSEAVRRKDMIPADPMILLSYVNTQLRDFYPDLTSFCKDNGLDQEEICRKLRVIDYEYDEGLNKFV